MLQHDKRINLLGLPFKGLVLTDIVVNIDLTASDKNMKMRC